VSTKKTRQDQKIEVLHTMLTAELVKLLEIFVSQFCNEVYMAKGVKAKEASTIIEKQERNSCCNQILIVTSKDLP
jgi:hypothetical protein